MNHRYQDAHDFLELLQAIFPLEGELIMDEPTSKLLHNPPSESEPYNWQQDLSELNFKLRVDIPKDSIKFLSQVDSLYIGCSLDLKTNHTNPKLWLDRHSHLDHSSWQQLSGRIENELKSELSIVTIENLTDTLTHLSQKLPEWVQEIKSSDLSISTPITIVQNPSSIGLEDHDHSNELMCTRAWFKFPSLSTKSKRNDLVNLAIKYSMTGFVMAGKPAWLAIEIDYHQVLEIERYWSEIKTVSWADIPSFQKKVTEVMREVKVKRCFGQMKEVTEFMISHSRKKLLNPHHNKSDHVEKEEIADWLRRLGIPEETLLVVLGFSRT
ncbi:uncharacterized protein MELLADRAFT_68368 [Melampsora larici-populina 98AG31]|uniref:Small nuclear ribonucleoprotein Prp3 C-terminal domain-containing protein n=1 Tax=Melampsora larici-populina (strain 98AG31 / pathotype 3-4-7) TaxID=747676 RepID=F4S6K1_MELLP|nr:uncharacterized protein MELLADRAFT_68368 [Melampsora larici-populina 98AG31]EGF99744.1 hypothetical protein MELLADRAFT_68368 [Melampsora larici-populina 98AG31]